MKWSCLLILGLLAVASAQNRPVVTRPESTRRYTTALAIDGGGFRCMITVMVLIEVEDAIKRYLLENPQYLPEDAEIETVDDFDVLLADYFDAMSGVSAGVWTSGYLASKGGDGAADNALSDRRINRLYGNIIPGGARGLEVFFMEYGEMFYPGEVGLNITPPTLPPDLLSGNLSSFAQNAADAATGLVTGEAAGELLAQLQIPGVTAAFYSADGLEEVLELFMGETKLSELSTYYVANAYDLIKRLNVYFVHDTTPADRSVAYTAEGIIRSSPRDIPSDETGTDYRPDNDIINQDFFIRDIARASSALPAFHPSKTMSPIDNEDITYVLIDGAIITNNPALQALVFLTTAPQEIPIEDIAMISFGSGVPLLDFSTNVNSAALGWMLNNELVTIMTDGSAENVQSQVDFLFYGNPDVLPGQYLRIQTTADYNSTTGEALRAPTDTESLPVLRTRGLEVAETYKPAIENFVQNFIFAE